MSDAFESAIVEALNNSGTSPFDQAISKQLETISGSRRATLDTAKRLAATPPILMTQPDYSLPDGLVNRAPALSISDPAAEQIVRAGANILTAPLKIAPNLANLVERGIRWRLGNRDQPVIHSGQEVLDRGLAGIGINPTPASNAERYGTVGGEALLTAGLMGLPALPQITGALAGTAASDLVQKAYPNAPVWAAPLAGMVGGGIVGAATPVAQRMMSGANAVRQYFTEKGNEQAAGRWLNRMATEPEQVPARVDQMSQSGKISLLPGSQGTLPEVTQNPGLAGAWNTLPATQAGVETGAIAMRGNRLAQSDAAVRGAIDRGFQTKGGAVNVELGNELTRRQNALNAQLRKAYDLENIPVDIQPLQQQLSLIRQRYNGKENVTNLIDDLQDQISKEAKSFASLSKASPDKLAEFLDNAYQRAYEKYPDKATAIWDATDKSINGRQSQISAYQKLVELGNSPVGKVLGKRPDSGATLTQAVAKLGGIDKSYMADAIGESKLSPTVRKGMPGGLFKNGGRSPDDMAMALRDAGYLTDTQLANMDGVPDMLRMIENEISGRQYYYHPDQVGNSQAAAAYDRAFEHATTAQQPALLPLPEATGTSAQFLWNARQNLDNKIYERNLNSPLSSRQELGKIGEIIRKFYNRAITDQVPGFQPYLDQWSNLQRVKDRMHIGEQVVKNSSLANRNALTPDQVDSGALYGDARLSLPKYERAIDTLKGTRSEWRNLTLEQKDLLTGPVADELRRRQFLDTGGRGIGSDTAQKLAGNNALLNDLAYAITGNPQSNISKIAGLLGKPLSYVSGSAVEDIMRNIQNGMVDPLYGASLMRNSPIPKPFTLWELGLGAGYGALSPLVYGAPIQSPAR